jgi:protein O-GlcNAc transferase
MLAVALRHHQAGHLGEAERLYRQILQADSRNADALHLLGVLALQAARTDAAVDLIGKAIEQNGRVPAFHNNLGNALKAQGKLAQAAASYSRALVYNPDYVEAHYNLGIALQAQDRLDEAVASYKRALSRKPDHVEAHINLGNTLQAQGRLEQAVACYEQALTIRPSYAEAHGNLGNVHKTLGRLNAAVSAYQRALALKPDYAEAHSNLGIVLMEQGKFDEAVSSCSQALLHRPAYAEAHNNLGNALQAQGRSNEAVASYARALALKPDDPEASLNVAMATIPIFAHTGVESVGTADRFAQSLDGLAAWNRAHPGKLGKAIGSNQPFYLAYRPFDVSGLLCRYGDLACAASAAHWSQQTADRRIARPPQDHLRVAIVSGQVREHPVWDVILRGIISHMDRRQFEVFLYHTGAITDEETAWAKSRVDRFVQGPKPLKGWLEEITQDRPDVMFYPEVGMDPATIALAALRLAPLQVAGWGHPVTTGLPSMDLFLSGELLEGQGAEQQYREQLIRLPGTGVCTEPTAVQSQRWEGPARESDVVRFALCQQPIKFDPADDMLLARIAKAVGPSEFWIASPVRQRWTTVALRDRLATAFRSEGLDPDAHLRVMQWLPRNQFLGFLDEMHVYLDCPAFSGYTTAWQAIHRGVPIVTLEGEFLRQRLAAGLLRQIGIIDGIASSREQYVEIAVRWAQECGQSQQSTARRETISRAAAKADMNLTAVRAFEQTLIDRAKPM